MVRLSELVTALGGACEPAAAREREIRDVQVDSRRVGAGELFAALPGRTVDGARFAADALARGAAAVLSPAPLELPRGAGREVANWIHPAARRVTGEAAAIVHARPARAQAVVGITGTNGKTTTAHLAGALLAHAGRRPAVAGTVGCTLWGGDVLPAAHTTPDATELQRLLAANLARGGDAFVLEVSSHALDQERTSGLELDVAVFTNLTRDHLDYHGTLEAYAQAKARIFGLLKPGGAAAVHAGDARAPAMIEAARRSGARVVTFGTGSRADLVASRVAFGPQGIDLLLDGMGIPGKRLRLPLVGRHNLENALAAAAAGLLLGASPSRVLEGLAAASAPPGRLERVAAPGESARGFPVYVDYAHTPDALERVLDALRPLAAARGRLIVAFGCGGDRDRGKRAPMGAVAARLADVVIVTSDNPRSEDPDAIAAEVARGADGGRAEVHCIVERRAAIRRALELAREGDVVLVAGKGHETWQERLGERQPFDDRKVVVEELAR